MKMTQARPVTKTGRLDACVQVSGAKKIAVRRIRHIREANASGRKVNATSCRMMPGVPALSISARRLV
jgi:hypothetical protein